MPIEIEGFTEEVISEMRGQRIFFASNNAELFEEARADGFEDFDLLSSAARDVNSVVRTWQDVEECFPSWTCLKGANILDIASGSACSTYLSGVTFPPYFSRLCAVNGADVTAIDFNPQGELDKILFTGIQADVIPLVVEERLSMLSELQGRKFDIIHSSAFCGSDIDPKLLNDLGGVEQVKRFHDLLIAECQKMLAEGGVLFLDDLTEESKSFGSGTSQHINYRMVNGTLVQVVK